MVAVPELRRHLLLAAGRRGGLPYSTLHGEPLYAHALRALAGVPGRLLVAVDARDRSRVDEDLRSWRVQAEVVVGEEWWAGLVDAPGAGLVVHDPLCPLVTVEFLRSLVERADEEPATSLVAVRPVTDTLKAVVGGRIMGTVDRERLCAVTSPLVIPPALLVDGAQPPPIDDFAQMVGWLGSRGRVEQVRAPSLSRRVEHERAIDLLECVEEAARRVRG